MKEMAQNTGGGVGRCTRYRGQKNTIPTTCYQHGTGLPVKAYRGVSGCVDGGGRHREEGTLGQENPLGWQGPWRRLKTKKGGQPDYGRQSQARTRNSFVRLSWEGSADERWRPTYGCAVQVYGRSAPRQGGGGSIAKREITVVNG